MLRKLKKISENSRKFSSRKQLKPVGFESPNAVYRSSLSSSFSGLLVLAAERMIPTSAMSDQAANKANADNTNNSSSPVSYADSVTEAPPLVTESTMLPEPFESAEAIAPEPTRWQGLAIGAFLVSGPVFLEAPLVRTYPITALTLTLGWLGLAWWCDRQDQRKWWGDILFGFSLSWFAGAVYWGWFRWEPLWHLPIESIGLPIALWGLHRGWGKVGHCFYLGSLLGTAITDLYFYRLNLMPYWRQLMVSPPAQSLGIVQAGFAQVQTREGAVTAIVAASGLLILAWQTWRSPHRHHWVFSGTLLGTLLVDSLFVALAAF